MSRMTHSRILSRGSFRDLCRLRLVCCVVPFKQPGYEKAVETFSRLADTTDQMSVSFSIRALTRAANHLKQLG